MSFYLQTKLEILVTSLNKICEQVNLLRQLCDVKQITLEELNESLILISKRMEVILFESKALHKALGIEEENSEIINRNKEQLDEMTSGLLQQYKLLVGMDQGNSTIH